MSTVFTYENYKNSGIEWLGKIPSHWDVIKLKHLVKMKIGEAITATNMDEDGYPVYGGNGLRGYFRNYTHDGEYILIGRQGALCGNINYATGKFWASEHAVVLSPRKQIAKKWMGELLRSMNLNQYSIAAAQPGLSVEAISNLKIPFPPLNEQQKIAEYFEKITTQIDSAIAKKQRLIELLQEQKSILINQAVTRGLNPNVPIRESGIEWIGRIPSHWKILPNKALFRERSEPGNSNLPILSVSLHTGVSDNEQDETENLRAKTRIEDRTAYKKVYPGGRI